METGGNVIFVVEFAQICRYQNTAGCQAPAQEVVKDGVNICKSDK